MTIWLAYLVGCITCCWAAYTDYKKQIIPNSVVLINVIAAILIFRSSLIRNGHLWLALSMFAVMFAMWLFKLIGAGDAKLLPSLVLLLGYNAFFAIFFALVIFIATGYLKARRTAENFWKFKMPLAPFLIPGMVLSIILKLLIFKNLG
ncbi:prepilin peptidase [Anaerocellum danielii]|uniref:A24 family peptidase n=1 Tax=Anaerocellum danielii TaxID=1387557 RepID=A0ABZ0TXJ3_9FIRM|nr:A24 family peptidase [Caldicellulosiruptor danielii]WPX08156.1 A24 family peptidase [Caldicellulosiruptor danielii]